MQPDSLSELTDAALQRSWSALDIQHQINTAELLASIAEVDARKLYRTAGYANMFEYLLGEFRMCEEEATERICAARAAREFPVLFEAIADGRLNPSALVLLAPHLSAENVDELVLTATHRRMAELEHLLAERFS
jgi:hypothetical protein